MQTDFTVPLLDPHRSVTDQWNMSDMYTSAIMAWNSPYGKTKKSQHLVSLISGTGEQLGTTFKVTVDNQWLSDKNIEVHVLAPQREQLDNIAVPLVVMPTKESIAEHCHIKMQIPLQVLMYRNEGDQYDFATLVHKLAQDFYKNKDNYMTSIFPSYPTWPDNIKKMTQIKLTYYSTQNFTGDGVEPSTKFKYYLVSVEFPACLLAPSKFTGYSLMDADKTYEEQKKNKKEYHIGTQYHLYTDEGDIQAQSMVTVGNNSLVQLYKRYLNISRDIDNQSDVFGKDAVISYLKSIEQSYNKAKIVGGVVRNPFFYISNADSKGMLFSNINHPDILQKDKKKEYTFRSLSTLEDDIIACLADQHKCRAAYRGIYQDVKRYKMYSYAYLSDRAFTSYVGLWSAAYSFENREKPSPALTILNAYLNPDNRKIQETGKLIDQWMKKITSGHGSDEDNFYIISFNGQAGGGDNTVEPPLYFTQILQMSGIGQIDLSSSSEGQLRYYPVLPNTTFIAATNIDPSALTRDINNMVVNVNNFPDDNNVKFNKDLIKGNEYYRQKLIFLKGSENDILEKSGEILNHILLSDKNSYLWHFATIHMPYFSSDYPSPTQKQKWVRNVKDWHENWGRKVIDAYDPFGFQKHSMRMSYQEYITWLSKKENIHESDIYRSQDLLNDVVSNKEQDFVRLLWAPTSVVGYLDKERYQDVCSEFNVNNCNLVYSPVLGEGGTGLLAQKHIESNTNPAIDYLYQSLDPRTIAGALWKDFSGEKYKNEFWLSNIGAVMNSLRKKNK
jgi:hypothetical protein